MQLIYGPDLFANGWDPTPPHDTLTNSSITQHNMAVFGMAVAGIDKVTLRCCGC